MPLPVRHLPVIQNWDCHACGTCCKEYSVAITDAERQRIDDQGWANRPEFVGVPLVVKEGRWGSQYRLNHRADGSCVFLGENGLCRIHAEFGGTQKPLACQVYPYVLVPAGDHWRVGVRYACPSASANKGREVLFQRKEIQEYARQLEERENVAGRTLEPPPLQGNELLSWADLGRMTSALVEIVTESGSPIEYRMRKAIALAALCRQAKFGEVKGNRLIEFLHLVSHGLSEETPKSASELPHPGWIGRVLFRSIAALYARRDTGTKRGLAQKGRLALFAAAIRFTRGTGPVPKVHGWLPDVTFEEMERPMGPMPPASEALLERYYRVKLESYQFFGPTHFGRDYWDGFEGLALTLPVILWLSRAFKDKSHADAVETAVQIVDDNFGYNTLLGSRRHRWATRIMAGRGELTRLVAWYGR